MNELLERFKSKPPEIVFRWRDTLTEAEGWVVINSLRNGAAGGGTRMRQGLDEREVETLAKIMEIKFTVSGPAIGGAKSGINFDPNDPRKEQVLDRWFRVVSPLLKRYYGTGGDLNVDEVKEVIPLTENYGIWHPQEGIVNGHFQPTEREKILRIGQLRQGVAKKLEDPRYSPDITRKYAVADMATGYGTAVAVKHFYALFRKETLENKTAIIQGWGNVAAAAAFYLAQEGVRIIAIKDRHGGLIRREGFGFDEIKQLFLHREANHLPRKNLLSNDQMEEKFWDISSDIFIPGAASRLVSCANMEKLIGKGLKVVACGANAPFIEDDVFFGKTTRYVDERISLIPDFIANCGMARVFAYLMNAAKVEISDEAIFNDISDTIHRALCEVQRLSGSLTHITRNALDIALKKLIS
ncbi:MAG: amino acid dehydrogenase [Chitinophagales bacterium]|nr:MAG: amino acid dehydrogenase [Chitinophagales bacterium]